MKTVIVGYGETGKRLHQIVKDADVIDIELGFTPIYEPCLPAYEVILICIPDSDVFEIIMRNYGILYGPHAIIVFSRIPQEKIDRLGIHTCDFNGKLCGPENEHTELFLEEYFQTDN